MRRSILDEPDGILPASPEITNYVRIFSDRSIVESPSKDLLAEIVGVVGENKEGIYFWTACMGDRQVAVYIGRTKDVSRRIGEYLGKFQPRSPDDFKIRFFHEYFRNKYPEMTMSLYFRYCPSDEERKALEISEIRRFSPLINDGSDNAREKEKAAQKIKDAYRSYYAALFEENFEPAFRLSDPEKNRWFNSLFNEPLSVRNKKNG